MNSVITALGNPHLNNVLKSEKDINVMTNDIQYQEGIFEYFEKNKKIDFLILSELLQGNLEIKDLVEQIQQKNNTIKIIIILEKENEELENYLYSKGIFKIFYNNIVEINEIISLLKNEVYLNDNEKIIQEIESLKKILIKNNIQINDNNDLLNKNIEEKNYNNYNYNQMNILLKKIKKYNIDINFFKKKNNKKYDNDIQENRLNNKKIISILGTGGSREKHSNS